MIIKTVLSGEPLFYILIIVNLQAKCKKNTFPENVSEKGLTKAFQCDTM